MKSARRLALFFCLLVAALPSGCARERVAAHPDAGDISVVERDRRLMAADIAALASQRPGHVDLYTVGFAGDSTQDVFRNEVAYLDTLVSARFDGAGRVVTLVNHVDSLTTAPRPLATLDNLRVVLAGMARTMDPDEDVLLLYLTMHGTEDHELYVQLPPVLEDWITPRDLQRVLDASGIRNRVLVVSACYSGGFVPALRSPDTLVITAARADRPSFGCGVESDATYFGRAFLIDGLNDANGFADAFDVARQEIDDWEREDGELPSQPQVDVGARIRGVLDHWQAATPVGPTVPYPYDR